MSDLFDDMRTVIIIPAYNEAQTVADVVRRVREVIPDVLVIDDGSTDATVERAREAGAMVVRHCVNRGLGAAIGTGIAAVLRLRFSPSSGGGDREGDPYVDALVTLDADGQHNPADIPALLAPIASGAADLVIGVRPGSATLFSRARRGRRRGVDFSPSILEGEMKEGVYSKRIVRTLGNRVANVLTRVLFGVTCSDTQSGFRAFSRRAAERIDIRTNRMEVSSEILAEAARLGLRIAEVPIRTIYTDYSLAKGQGFSVGLQTAWALVLRKFL